MSILAQARLTLLASMRRNDILDICAHVQSSRYRSTFSLPAVAGDGQLQPTTAPLLTLERPLSTPCQVRQLVDFRQPVQDIPEQRGDIVPDTATQRRNQIHHKILVKKLFNEPTNLWVIDKQNTPHLVSNIFRHYHQLHNGSCSLKTDQILNSYLATNKPRPLKYWHRKSNNIILSFKHETNALSKANGWHLMGHQCHYHHHRQQQKLEPTSTQKTTKTVSKFYSDNYNSNHQQECYNFKLLSLVGLLGLFGKSKENDPEEERAKLTDEDKIKKMTPAELNIAKGVLAMLDQVYSKADEFFHLALQLAQQSGNEEQETLVLNLLAANYFESGDLENAEKLFIDLMKRMISNDVDPNDLAILELSLKLASIYSRNQNTHIKAMKGFKFVINSLLVKLQDLLNSNGELETLDINEDRKDELALLGWSYDWFAKHLIAENDYDGAIMLLNRALTISSRVLGPLHDQTLILLNDVGTTMAMNNSPKEGKEYLLKAVEGAIESQSKELASFYVNLGLVNLKLKQFSEAKRYCEYSIELALKNREHNNSEEVIHLSRSCLNEVERLIEVNK